MGVIKDPSGQHLTDGAIDWPLVETDRKAWRDWLTNEGDEEVPLKDDGHTAWDPERNAQQTPSRTGHGAMPKAEREKFSVDWSTEHPGFRRVPEEITDPNDPRVKHPLYTTLAPTLAANPKDRVGVKKASIAPIPVNVLAEVGIGMSEGSMKYGRHNFRLDPIQASIYYDATVLRHIMAWWEGEDVDKDSGLSHITKAICSLVVLRDAMMQDCWIDDRPLRSVPWLESCNKKMAQLVEKYPNPKPPITQKPPKDNS